MISREELYELVWSMPMTQASKRFSVSGSYLARVCKGLRVPRPERGYWAKLEVGKAPSRPPLPEPLPGDQLSWSQDGDAPTPRTRAVITTTVVPKPRVRRSVTGTHGLIRGAKQHYETGYKVDDGQLLRPYKRLLVDVTTSAVGVDKALGFANDLFNALESAGHRVWTKRRGPPVHLYRSEPMSASGRHIVHGDLFDGQSTTRRLRLRSGQFPVCRQHRRSLSMSALA